MERFQDGGKNYLYFLLLMWCINSLISHMNKQLSSQQSNYLIDLTKANKSNNVSKQC